ncbi:hypothetical protein XENORESO_007850 [Xenotaenia resolanae]|uniref:Uncharacterized protein n=1 Tax=Xenotaenia resolanae TaxID=208358 RepID=A0ABV0WET2_9TELE
MRPGGHVVQLPRCWNQWICDTIAHFLLYSTVLRNSSVWDAKHRWSLVLGRQHNDPPLAKSGVSDWNLNDPLLPTSTQPQQTHIVTYQTPARAVNAARCFYNAPSVDYLHSVST